MDLHTVNYWFYISIIEFCLIVFLILNRVFLKKTQHNKKQEILNSEADFENILNSSFNSKEVYDELKVKYHPDRFIDDENKRIIANQIFQEITENKYNFKKLQELKIISKEKLG